MSSIDILPVPKRLSSDRVTAISLLTTASYTYDVEVSGTDWITVWGDLTGAADADLSVSVTPFEDDGVTLSAFTIQPSISGGPTNQSGNVRFWAKYDVIGIGRARITWTNNNAGTQTLTRGSWRTAGY